MYDMDRTDMFDISIEADATDKCSQHGGVFGDKYQRVEYVIGKDTYGVVCKDGSYQEVSYNVSGEHVLKIVQEIEGED